MGTRADFYTGRVNGKTKTVTWLGSIAFDGYPSEFYFLLKAKNKREFVSIVNKMLLKRDDATLPKDGWPWPWDDSCLTDVAYAWDDGTVWATEFYADAYKVSDPVNGKCLICKNIRNGWLKLDDHRKFSAKVARQHNAYEKACDAVEEKRLKATQKLQHKKNPFEVAKIVEAEFPMPQESPELSESSLIKMIAEFPDMQKFQNVTLGKRSGVILLRGS